MHPELMFPYKGKNVGRFSIDLSRIPTNNSTRARLGWAFSYICRILVHPDLDLTLLFIGTRERSIVCCKTKTDDIALTNHEGGRQSS